jgi:UDP-glucose 4-epimerase
MFADAYTSTILLTGATGYIGSHTWLALHEAGFRVIGVDNFHNSNPKVLERLRYLMGTEPLFYKIDVTDMVALSTVFERHHIDALVHFAAYKSVQESIQKPLKYYENNIRALTNVARVMTNHLCYRIVFSSSATVYGLPDISPISEDAPLRPASPYAQTKILGEQILMDLAASDDQWRVACLRYFNPVGAHDSGQLGEDPRGTPHNLMPNIALVASGKRPYLSIFGNDYATPDGTCVRDYIHVMDLAEGHVAAVQHLFNQHASFVANLGCGAAFSVMDVLRAYEHTSKRTIAFNICARREGDVAAYYANPSLALRLMGWKTQRNLDAMCADSWRWQQTNPLGYDT